MSTWFEAYPYDVQIPTMAAFIADEGSWLAKFLTFFPPYFYEFFIQTAPVGYYPNATAAGQPIVMTGYPPVSPTLVARASPQPYLNASGNSSNPTFEMDLTRWYALALLAGLLLFYAALPFVFVGLLIVFLVTLVLGMLLRRGPDASDVHSALLRASGGGIGAAL